MIEKTNQEIETSYDEFLDPIRAKRLDRFHEIWSEMVEKSLLKLAQEIEECGEVELLPPGKHHKKRMNRLFRERLDSTFLPFPEADNAYERVRAKIIIKLRINKLIDRLEACKRKRQIKKYEKRHGML